MITNIETTQRFIKNISKLEGHQLKFQEQIATGQKITKPSDDGVQFGRVVKLESDKRNLIQLNRNAGVAEDLINVSTMNMEKLQDINVRGQEIARIASSGVNATGNTMYLEEVNQLIEEAVNRANASFQDKFLFSGTKVSAEQAQVDTLTVTNGTVSAGDTFSVTIDGTTVTTAALSASATADDVATALATAINADATTSALVTAAATGSSTGTLTLTADKNGVAFTAGSGSTTSAGGGALASINTTSHLFRPFDVTRNLVSATATTTVTSGAVQTPTLSNAGETPVAGKPEVGFAKAPTVTVIGDGSGSTATAILNGSVIDTVLVNGGTGYTSVPTVTIAPPKVYRDTLTVSAGTVTAGDTFSVQVNGSTITTAALAASASASDIAAALTTAINNNSSAKATASHTTGNSTISLIGTTSDDTFSVEATSTTSAGGGATTYASSAYLATATATINNGAVTGITVTSIGDHYTEPPAITLTGGGGGGAKVEATFRAKIEEIVIDTAGTDYSSATIAISDENDIQSVQYRGDATSSKFYISKDQKISANLDPSSNDAVFSTLINNLISLRNGLSGSRANATETAQNVGSKLISYEDQLLSGLAEMAGKQLTVDSSREFQSQEFLMNDAMISNAVDIDLAETMMKLTEARTAYQAALQTGAMLMGSSLLDYI